MSHGYGGAARIALQDENTVEAPVAARAVVAVSGVPVVLGGNRDYWIAHTTGQVQRIGRYAPFLRFYPCLRTLLPVFRMKKVTFVCLTKVTFFHDIRPSSGINPPAVDEITS